MPNSEYRLEYIRPTRAPGGGAVLSWIDGDRIPPATFRLLLDRHGRPLRFIARVRFGGRSYVAFRGQYRYGPVAMLATPTAICGAPTP